VIALALISGGLLLFYGAVWLIAVELIETWTIGTHGG
jgi:hypothetical protein